MTLKVPLSTLRVFEAAARRQSFHAAASELNLTPSAVSHAIRKMEESLGVVLFERVGRGVSLSSEGQTLMGYTERAFEEFQRGFEAVSARAPRLLRLHCAPSFAAQWLTPRLARFFAQHPDVEVRLSAGVEYARFDTGEFDADIIYGLPRQEGLVVLPLKEETVTPLCAPHLAEAIESPTDLLRHPLIQSDNKQIRWPAWFGINGIAVPATSRGSRFDRSFLALAAAADGLGVALESTLLAEREMLRGRLVAPLAGRAEDIRYVGHHLVYPRPCEQRTPLRLFAQWLARELDIVLTPFL
jgi:LysR family transcriptional regulator, glycine cleavage system transcriptional activator